jgi:hypothetical protein
MNQVSLAFITTLVTYCLICSDAFYINDVDETPSEPGYRDVLDLDTGGNAGMLI